MSFIGHFELVRALLPILQATEGARVVTLSSVMHWFGQRGASADWAMAAFDTYPLVRHAESPPTRNPAALSPWLHACLFFMSAAPTRLRLLLF